MSLGYGIPARTIVSHRSTEVPGGVFELTDNNLAGFDAQFLLRYVIAGQLISEEPFSSEVRAREAFEKRIERHYGYDTRRDICQG